jgi:hypothetical protein
MAGEALIEAANAVAAPLCAADPGPRHIIRERGKCLRPHQIFAAGRKTP